VKRTDYLERILKARVYDVAVESALEPARALSKRLGNRILLKREDLQPIFSFKLRGAYNKMAALPRARLARGVIAASAGNHAQGVALAAQRLGCRAVIVMPVTTPRIKVDAVRSRGAEVRLHGGMHFLKKGCLSIEVYVPGLHQGELKADIVLGGGFRVGHCDQQPMQPI